MFVYLPMHLTIEDEANCRNPYELLNQSVFHGMSVWFWTLLEVASNSALVHITSLKFHTCYRLNSRYTGNGHPTWRVSSSRVCRHLLFCASPTETMGVWTPAHMCLGTDDNCNRNSFLEGGEQFFNMICSGSSMTRPGSENTCLNMENQLPWELKTFIFRGYNPYIRGLKPLFFMVLGSKGIFFCCQKLPFFPCFSRLRG